MPTIEIVFRLIAGLILLLGNAFFVTVEFALTRLRQFERDELPDDAGVERAWQMTGRLELYLTGCQVGITLTSILLGVLAEPGVTALFEPLFEVVGISGAATHAISIVVAIVAINLAHTVWGEQAPTYLGVERPIPVIRIGAPVLYWWCKAIHPVLRVGDWLAKATLRLFGIEMTRSWLRTDDDEAEPARPLSYGALRRKMKELLASGGLPDDRRREVMQALEIGTLPVRQIMVPREQIVTLSAARPIEHNLGLLADHHYTRLPLVRESLDEPLGFVYVPALFGHLPALANGDRSLAELAVEPVFVPAELAVSDLVDRLQAIDQEIALVTEDDAVVGLVTSTDAFEAILGDMRDPFDPTVHREMPG